MTTYLIGPLFVVSVLYVFSAGREIVTLQRNRQLSFRDFADNEAIPSAFELSEKDRESSEEVIRI